MKHVGSSVTHWLYWYLASYTVIQWYLLSAALLMSVTVGWYTVLYRPVHKRISACSNEISLKNQTLQNSLDSVATYSQACSVVTALAADLEACKNKYVDYNGVLIALMTQAHNNKLEAFSCVLSETIDNDWYTITPARATVRGSLEAIGLWLKAVTQSLHLCAVEQLTLTSDANSLFRCSGTFHVMQIKKSPSTLGS